MTSAARRIVVVYPIYRTGGNELFILRLARGLPDFGWQVCAVNTGLPEGPLKPAYDKLNIPVVNCSLRTTDSYLSFLRRLRGAVLSFEPDILLTIDRDWGLQLAGQLPSVACVHKISNEDVCGYTAFLKDGYRDFDAIVGIRSSARLFGENVRLGVASCYGLALVLLFAALVGAGAGLPAYIGAAIFGVHLAWQTWRLERGDGALALRLFRSNRDAGLILFATLTLDALARARF